MFCPGGKRGNCQGVPQPTHTLTSRTPDDGAEPSAIDPPLLPGRPRLPEAPPTPHGRGVSDPVHLSPARDMVTLAWGARRQDRGLHAEGGASPAERSRVSTVRNKAEARPVRRGQGPVSVRRGGGRVGVAEAGCESVSAPSEGAARGGGGVRRRGRAVAGRGRGRAAQAQCEVELSFRAVPRRARAAQPRRRGRPPTPASASPTAAGVGLVG